MALSDTSTLISQHQTLFQHDNAPVHKARSIQKWFIEIGVEELDWPVQSTHLNSIKHLWNELERRLRARPNRPTSVPDLTNALMLNGSKSPAAIFQHLVECLPSRVSAVIAAMFQHLVESPPRTVEAVIAAMFQHLVESTPRTEEAVIAAVFRDLVGGGR